MSPFWSGFFEHLRSCGRNGAIFVSALVAFFATVIGTAVVELSGISFDPKLAAGCILAVLAVGIGVFVRRMRKARIRLRFPRLSDDELRVARERLKNHNRKN